MHHHEKGGTVKMFRAVSEEDKGAEAAESADMESADMESAEMGLAGEEKTAEAAETMDMEAADMEATEMRLVEKNGEDGSSDDCRAHVIFLGMGKRGGG